MPTNRKLLGAAAFSLALAGGGAAGALLGTPSLSGAQDDTEAVDDGDRPGFGAHRGEPLATAAEAIGISEEELRAALADGQSIAQVAETEGVDVETVIDALVADATERLQDVVDELPDRMAEVVEREGLADHRRRGGPGFLRGRGPGLDAAADALGITEDDLRTALRDGSSISNVAEANGVDVQTVIDALVAEATEHLDEEVAEGDLTDAEATRRRADLEDRITALVEGERPGRGPLEEGAANDA